MAYDTVVEGGTVVTATDTVGATIGIVDGRVAALLDPGRSVEADRRIDASGKHVLPGGVDPHVHMMDPGKTDREDFPTGTAAAAVGGITTVGDHHRTTPMVLSAEVLEGKRDHLADRARVDFALLAGGHPANVDEIEGLETAGAIAYASFACNVHGVPALQSKAMSAISAAIARVGGISMVHPEDDRMVNANAERLQAAGRTDGAAVNEWRSKAAVQVATVTTMTIAE
jgi:dihydroorotase-like cyclic amidohydrolase